MEGNRSRRAGRFDAAASLAARALPNALTPWIEQARLDATMIIDRTSGKTPAPLVDDIEAPPPLSEVDPLNVLPPGIADKVRAVRRDVQMLRDRLILGKNPPPVIERPRGAAGAVVSLFTRKHMGLLMLEVNKGLEFFEQHLETGAIVPAIERTYSLDETPEALRRLGDGQAAGKLVITQGPDE